MRAGVITPKERVRRALLNQDVDYLPTQINYTAAFGENLASYFEIPAGQLPHHFGNHLLRVDISHQAKISAADNLRFDWWGVGFDTKEEGYFAAYSPLVEQKDLDRYSWPDPLASGLLVDAEKTIAGEGQDYFVVPNFGFAMFERAWSLRGFEQFFLDMAMDPEYAGALLERITGIQLALIHRYLDMGIDGGYFGDDYGAQKNLLFSPRMWRKFIKPRLARLFAPFTERGLPIIMHSDGQIQDIIPDLLEIGLTTLNPVQPEVIDHHWLRTQYGGRLSFYGGISTQTVLPHISESGVEDVVKRVTADLAPDGTGLIIAPSHRLMSDVPVENVAALRESFRELRP